MLPVFAAFAAFLVLVLKWRDAERRARFWQAEAEALRERAGAIALKASIGNALGAGIGASFGGIVGAGSLGGRPREPQLGLFSDPSAP